MAILQNSVYFHLNDFSILLFSNILLVDLNGIFISLDFLVETCLYFQQNGKTNNNLLQRLIESNRELDCGKFNHSNRSESPWNCLLPANVPRRLSHAPIQFGSSRLPLCCRSTTTKNSSFLPTFPIHESHIILGDSCISLKERSYRILRYLSFST